jgi:hypothetical protein
MRKNASRPDAENPEWTAEEIRQARPLMETLPKEAVEAIRRYRGQRGPQKSPTKELIVCALTAALQRASVGLRPQQ